MAWKARRTLSGSRLWIRVGYNVNGSLGWSWKGKLTYFRLCRGECWNKTSGKWNLFGDFWEGEVWEEKSGSSPRPNDLWIEIGSCRWLSFRGWRFYVASFQRREQWQKIKWEGSKVIGNAEFIRFHGQEKILKAVQAHGRVNEIILCSCLAISDRIIL